MAKQLRRLHGRQVAHTQAILRKRGANAFHPDRTSGLDALRTFSEYRDSTDCAEESWRVIQAFIQTPPHFGRRGRP
jgi:hypothetical protein